MSHDLTGKWSGIFNYPHTHPPTAFEADLADLGGSIVGTVHEPDLFSVPPGALIAAAIDGHCEGAKVAFSKFYDESEGYADMVVYAGALSDDGCEISGRWDIPGVWSGTFLMIRPTAVVPAGEVAGEAVADLPPDGTAS
ncbi:hypothetical protein ASG37_06530 [Sphingomonas sp. Leaf407]|uniref:hypothetical protein n=1 Tax=unclassified Sphingomonas TaxID=196159 RepID=UPI0006FC7825|nr:MULTISPECIES: hypothetical protein [unclassified Sphingomonas]KQN39242.1 hypothetical protein ASE97_03820 [Sphingomonas sp. Leaf42]KQT28518.1 hypothetical protein ASG37_06530 [Sphingomonas sp. Leaf407]